MRKLFTLLSVIALCNTAAFAQIPNPSFDLWGTTTTGSFLVPTGWSSLDSITDLAGFHTCNQGAPGFVGPYFVELLSHSTGSAVTPGVAVSGKMSYITPYGPKSGFQLTTRPAFLSGEWRYKASGTDQGFIMVFLSKWNLTTSRRDTIAFTKYNLPNPSVGVTTWTPFNIHLPYYAGTAPDSGIIALSSSILGGTGAADGSYLDIDTLSFTGSVATGLITLEASDLNEAQAPEISIYPNPASGVTNISMFCTAAGDARISLYNIEGRIIKEMNTTTMIGTNNIPVNISGVPKGIYFIKVVDDQFTSVKKITIE